MIQLRRYVRAGNTALKFVNIDFSCHSRCIFRSFVPKESRETAVGKQIRVQQLRSYSAETEAYESLEEYHNFHEYLSNHDLKSVSNYFRNLLYSESDDEIILKLKSCSTCKEVFDITDNIHSCTPQQLTQAVLILRDIQKTNETMGHYSTGELLHDTNDIVQTPSFNNLTISIVNTASQMDLQELSCCLLYLNKFGVSSNVLYILITKFEEKLNTSTIDDISTSSLARFSIPVRKFQNMWSMYTLADLLPILKCKLDLCYDYNELRQITICLQKMTPLIDSNFWNKYVEKCQFLLHKNEDFGNEIDRMRTILKCAVFLNYKMWHSKELQLVKQLLLSMHGSLNLLSIEEIMTLHSVVFYIQEPYQILNEINRITVQWLPQFKAARNSHLQVASMLYMFPQMNSLSIADCVGHVEDYFNQPVSSSELYPGFANVYNVFINSDLKNNRNLVDRLWIRATDIVNSFPAIVTVENVVLLCSRYLTYHSNHRYSNAQFESCAVCWLSQLLTERRAFLSPSNFCKLSLFAIFFKNRLPFVEDSDYENLLSAMSRVKMVDTASVSFILLNIFNRYSKKQKASPFLSHYINLVSALNNHTMEFLRTNEHVNADLVHRIFRGYSLLQGTKYTELFKLICDKMVNTSSQQRCSKHIREGLVNFANCGHLEPAYTDNAVAYCIDQRNLIHAYTGAAVLNHCFMFGYTPKRCEDFIEAISEIIARDKDSLPSYRIVHVALALCYYNSCPVDLTDYIFNVKFLQRVDDDIKTSMNWKRSRLLRNNFVELNKAVCIDFPNRDVPWFHEQFCKERRSLVSDRPTGLLRDVIRTLNELISVKSSIQPNRYSSYHHKIDVLIHTNKKGEPVDPEKCRPDDLRKIAVLVNNSETPDPYYAGKAQFDMRTRHLEILGYKVIEIRKYLWNSMYMSEPQAKENYLCNLIWSR